MANRLIDLTGRRFGALSVLSLRDTRSRGYAVWNCLCDCGNTATVRGSHLTSGQATCGPRHKEPLAARFWSKVDTSPGHGPQGSCWLWTAGTNEDGYGKLQTEDGSRGAHCVSWLLHYGANVGELQVLHRCDNPPCVNPDHLTVGSVKNIIHRKSRVHV